MAAALIIANLRSGRGRARLTLPVVTSALQRAHRDYELLETPGAEETADLLAAALRRERHAYDRVIVLGGDGTINGVVNGLMASGESLPLGIVPSGTGNEIVRSLGIPKNPEKAMQIVLTGREYPIDVGKVNERYFLNTFGLGADVEVVKMVNTLRSRYRFARNRSVYYLAALLLLSSGFDPFEAEIQVGDRVFQGHAVLIAAANGRIYGERLLALPAPSLTDGLLDLYLLEEFGSRRFRKTARLLRRLPVPELSVERCSQVTITLDQEREGQVDGSLLTPAQTFNVSLLPQQISVIHPVVPALVRSRRLTPALAGVGAELQ